MTKTNNCPQCNHFLGKDFDLKKCPECGTRIKSKVQIEDIAQKPSSRISSSSRKLLAISAALGACFIAFMLLTIFGAIITRLTGFNSKSMFITIPLIALISFGFIYLYRIVYAMVRGEESDSNTVDN